MENMCVCVLFRHMNWFDFQRWFLFFQSLTILFWAEKSETIFRHSKIRPPLNLPVFCHVTWRNYRIDKWLISKRSLFKSDLYDNYIDPRADPTVTAGSDHCLCTCRPSVRPSVPNFSKQIKFQAKTMFATGETVGLAEWIIGDTCLV